MFRITEDPSSGSLVECLDKNYKNDSIVSVDMDKVRVMAACCDPMCVCVCVCVWCVCVVHCICRHSFIYSELYTRTTVTICCHNTDLVNVNGHDRIILVIFSQALYKAP